MVINYGNMRYFGYLMRIILICRQIWISVDSYKYNLLGRFEPIPIWYEKACLPLDHHHFHLIQKFISNVHSDPGGFYCNHQWSWTLASPRCSKNSKIWLSHAHFIYFHFFSVEARFEPPTFIFGRYKAI